MRYCPTCDEEYQDGQTTCSEDGTALLDRASYEAELARQGRTPLPRATLRQVGTFADRFEADELAQALADEGIDVALVADKAPTVGPLTQPGPTLFTIVVPDSMVERAARLLAEWRPELEATRAEAAAAAEREEEEAERAAPL